MIKLANELQNVKTVAISGHIRPDGDCVGSCLAVWNYIQDNYPDIEADVYLEQIVPKFRFLRGADRIKTEVGEAKTYDLFLSLDASDKERLGSAAVYFDSAVHTVCIDHHITNPGFAEKNWIVAEASSASELAWETMEENKISRYTAEALYMGIAHDTGVFQYSNTSPKTMQIAGSLIAKGIDFSRIVDDTFYKKTYVQNLHPESDSGPGAGGEHSSLRRPGHCRPDPGAGSGFLWSHPCRSGWYCQSASGDRRSRGSHFPL